MSSRVESRNELDAMVVNVELTVNSIIQGVALSFLADNARNILNTGRASMWLYVIAGLFIVLLFWVRSLIHTLTLMRWPLELGHNCLYFAAALIEVLAFTRVTDPVMWFSLLTVFSALIWAIFVYDLRVIRQRQADSAGPNASRLYALVLRDQLVNIRFVVPALFVFNLTAALVIHRWPWFFLAQNGHLFFITAELVGLVVYLALVIRSFAKMTPLITATREDWRSGAGTSTT